MFIKEEKQWRHLAWQLWCHLRCPYSGSQCWVLNTGPGSSFSFLGMYSPGRRKWWLKYLGLCHRPVLISGLLASFCSITGCCRYFRSEPMVKRSFWISVSASLPFCKMLSSFLKKISLRGWKSFNNNQSENLGNKNGLVQVQYISHQIWKLNIRHLVMLFFIMVFLIYTEISIA